MVRVTIEYDIQTFLVTVKVDVIIDGVKAFRMRPGEIKSVDLEPGRHDILVKGSFRKRLLVKDISRDCGLRIRWNRLWGSIDILELDY